MHLGEQPSYMPPLVQFGCISRHKLSDSGEMHGSFYTGLAQLMAAVSRPEIFHTHLQGPSGA